MTNKLNVSQEVQLVQAIVNLQTGLEMALWSSAEDNYEGKAIKQAIESADVSFHSYFEKPFRVFVSECVMYAIHFGRTYDVKLLFASTVLIRKQKRVASFLKGLDLANQSLVEIDQIVENDEELKMKLTEEKEDVKNPFAEGIEIVRGNFQHWTNKVIESLKGQIGSFNVNKLINPTMLELLTPKIDGVELLAFKDGITGRTSNGYETITENIEGTFFPVVQHGNLSIRLVDAEGSNWCMLISMIRQTMTEEIRDEYVIQSTSYNSLWKYFAELSNWSMENAYIVSWMDSTVNMMVNKEEYKS